MLSKPIIEALLFKIPNIKVPLTNLGVINNERMYGSAEHKELKNIMRYFDDDLMIAAVYSSKMIIVVYSMKMGVYRKMPILYIEGQNARLELETKRQSSRYLLNRLQWEKEYIPRGTVKRIVFVNKFDSENIYGNIYTEWLFGSWTDNSGLKLNETKPFKLKMDEKIDEFIDPMYDYAMQHKIY